jgi:hypothetical protein
MHDLTGIVKAMLKAGEYDITYKKTHYTCYY